MPIVFCRSASFPLFAAILLMLGMAVPPLVAADADRRDCVVLLHGLARSSASMAPLAAALEAQGYVVANVDYPSRKKAIPELATLAVNKGLASCPETIEQVHFVTHSLGGILIRYYLEATPIPRLGRVVMLGPPNQGSEVVDHYRNVPGFGWLNGPAGVQLGTDQASIPASLGSVNFNLGVIAGTTSVNPILSLSLPGIDDGKVSVERAKVEGMTDFVALPHSHPLMMKAPPVIEQVIEFLAHGEFR